MLTPHFVHYRQDGPTVLVGHSWGGTVITEAGMHPNVAALVYIAAFQPEKAAHLNSQVSRCKAFPGKSESSSTKLRLYKPYGNRN